jgi:hypothetical protein
VNLLLRSHIRMRKCGVGDKTHATARCKTHATVRDQPLTDWPLTGKEKPLTESTAKQRPEATN